MGKSSVFLIEDSYKTYFQFLKYKPKLGLSLQELTQFKKDRATGQIFDLFLFSNGFDTLRFNH